MQEVPIMFMYSITWKSLFHYLVCLAIITFATFGVWMVFLQGNASLAFGITITLMLISPTAVLMFFLAGFLYYPLFRRTELKKLLIK